MKKLMTIAAAALACVAMAQEPENAAPRGPMAQRGHGPMMERGNGPMMQRGEMGPGAGADSAVMAVMNPRVAEKIGLSDEVRAQIKDIDQKSRESVRELQKKTREAMKKQADLMSAEKVDEGAVMGAIDELFDLRKEMAKSQTRRVIAVKSLLTPEQLKAATEEMKRERENRRMGRGNGPRGEGPRGKMGERHGDKGPHHGDKGPEGDDHGPKDGDQGPKPEMGAEGELPPPAAE